MAHIERGDNRQYFSSEAQVDTSGENSQLALNSINSGISITQRANESALAKNQIELSSEFLAKNNEINTKYQADPTNPERETELQEAFDMMSEKYKINPVCAKQWNDIKTDIYGRYKTYNAQWQEKQQYSNIQTNLKTGYETLMNQVSMLGMNGAGIDEMRLVYANGIDGLRKGAISTLGEVTVNDALKSSTHDCMAMYLDGLAQTNPAKVLEMLDNPNSGVANDLGNSETIEKIKTNAQSKMLKQTQVEAVDRIAGYITKNNDLFKKALDGTITTAEAQSILSDKNVDRTMRNILSDMLGYSSKSDLWTDSETGEIHSIKADKAKEDALENALTGASDYSTLTIGNKKWSFVNAKGKVRQPNTQEKQEISNELYLRGSQLLNNVEGKTPQESIRKIAEFQSQIAQASFFGLDKGDYNKLMNTFVLPATQNIQESAKGYNAHINQWGHIDKFGYEQIDKYFNNFASNLEDTKGNRDLVAREKALASVYYWTALNNHCSQNGISIQTLQKMDRHETASLYNKCAQSAIQKAKSNTSSPEVWFRSMNPQYVSAIRNRLPNSNANNVITNIAVATFSNPNMSDKDYNNIINREVANEYAKMRTKNKSVVFGGNTKYDEIINKYAMLHGVDPLLVKSIIKQESGFNANARSGAGAGGLMQLMPSTAKGLGCKNVYDPKQNISAGTLYISNLLKKYNGNTQLALAAYNAGSGNVNKYRGIPPFKETQNYVKNVMATYNRIKG